MNEPVIKRYHVLRRALGVEHSNTTNTNLSEEITKLESQFATDLDSVKTQAKLDLLYVKYLGKKGSTTQLLKSLQGLTLQDKQKYGPVLNELKKSQESEIKDKSKLLASNSSLLASDLTIPGQIKTIGRLHPTTVIIREMNEFFTRQGFSIGEGPEIEDVEYNFRRLNLPDGRSHRPARLTLIQEPNLLLRTQTSSIGLGC